MLSCTLRSVPKKFVSCYNIRANVRTASWPLGFHANTKLITNQHTANVTNVSGVVSNYKCIQSRRFSSNATDAVAQAPELKSKYDAIIIGAGHNGLVAATYLQKQGLNVCVVERRHVIGGAAVTEEIVPGFKFSRASYVLSLLRPQIIEELELKKHGLKVYLRNPNSYTPMLEPPGKSGRPRSLLLSADKSETARQIAQFSEKDAQRYAEYEEWLDRLVAGIEPLLDSPPVSLQTWTSGSLTEKWKDRGPFKTLIQTGKTLGDDLASFYEMLTAPATKILDKWFESEPLKATLATDAVIGAMQSPFSPGSGYVLIHHVMGELEGVKGAWGYVEGGMGAVSQAIANSARSHGTTVVTDKPVSQIKTDGSSNVTGIVLEDGTEIHSNLVLSNATPKVTYLDLVEKGVLPEDFVKAVEGIDYTSPVTKINIAVNALPNFLANPNTPDGKAQGHHMSGTIHLNCENVDIVHEAYVDAMQGKPSNRAVIEMTIPSSLDPTLAPPGCHVVQLFTQYTPYTLAGGKEWDDDARNAYADKVIDDIEQYAPGFRASIVGRDILTPPDLERIFNLTGGNIFHGSMNMDQLYFSRPVPAYSDYRSPVRGLYLCGSGAHPGGGVMGSPGRLAAMTVLSDIKTKTVQV